MEYTTLVNLPDYFGLKTVNFSSHDLDVVSMAIEAKAALGKEGLYVLPNGRAYNLATGEITDNFNTFTFASVSRAVEWYNSTQATHQAFVAQPDFPHQ